MVLSIYVFFGNIIPATYTIPIWFIVVDRMNLGYGDSSFCLKKPFAITSKLALT